MFARTGAGHECKESCQVMCSLTQYPTSDLAAYGLAH